MAIDQRSGNRSKRYHQSKLLSMRIEKLVNVGYAGAKQDVEAAIDYLYTLNGNQVPIILVGSSYSASLSLMDCRRAK